MEFLVVFSRTEVGPHGFYLVTYPYDVEESKIEGSVTIDLKNSAVQELERGVVLVAQGLYRKVNGWRAKRILRKATPEDLVSKKQKNSKGEEKNETFC